MAKKLLNTVGCRYRIGDTVKFKSMHFQNLITIVSIEKCQIYRSWCTLSCTGYMFKDAVGGRWHDIEGDFVRV